VVPSELGDAEETVAETAESLLAFENTGLPLCLMLPNGRLVMANRAMRTLLGYEFAELMAMNIPDVVPEAEMGLILEEWNERAKSGERVSAERRVRIRRKDGRDLDVRASSVIVPDGQGFVRYIVARALRVESSEG
jgi:PAS domain S-box-containing protein